MKPSEIKACRTYRNRGAGRTLRKVIEIVDHLPKGWTMPWYGRGTPPSEPVVRYEQKGKISLLYLSSFSAWAGSEVQDETAV